MKNVFKKSDTFRSKRTQHQNNLIVPRPNYYEFGAKSLASLGSKIRNPLPVNFTSVETFEVLKKTCQNMERRNAICAHMIRIIKSCQNKKPKKRR